MKTALCWLGSTVILAGSLFLIVKGWYKTAVFCSAIANIVWGIFTGAKGWSYFGRNWK